ncbi:CDCA3 protein, partial [Arenaria interpres]|nr:CDCA3 protein [Arenaria interpres]
QVVSSPVDSPQPAPAEPAVGTTRQDWDPRSPTPGISRTPMRAVSSDSVDCLVKQLSEAFGDEAAPPEPSAVTCPAEDAEELARRSPPLPAAAPGEETERLSSPSPGAAPARPARVAGPGFSSGKCFVWGLTGLEGPRARQQHPGGGSKPIRRKTNNKIMATSGGTGRSPLSILQDDNSPGAPAPRQGKRHVLGENIVEKKEVIVDLSRSLKSGNCAWSNLNKENQQCPFVEN